MHGEPLISLADALLLIALFLVYFPICLFAFSRLIPHFSRAAKLLASSLLVIQLTAIAISLTIQPSSWFEALTWELRHEWNIPSTLASTQLALVGGLALITAWQKNEEANYQRIYFVGVGIVFLFLAHDEYYKVHEGIQHWQQIYIGLGSAIVLTTIIAAVFSPRNARTRHYSLLVGLAVAALGGIVFENLPACLDVKLLRLHGCLPYSILEELLEFAGIWLVLVAVLGHLTHAAIPRAKSIRILPYALPVVWISLIYLNAFVPRIEFHFLASPYFRSVRVRDSLRWSSPGHRNEES